MAVLPRIKATAKPFTDARTIGHAGTVDDGIRCNRSISRLPTKVSAAGRKGCRWQSTCNERGESVWMLKMAWHCFGSRAGPGSLQLGEQQPVDSDRLGPSTGARDSPTRGACSQPNPRSPRCRQGSPPGANPPKMRPRRRAGCSPASRRSARADLSCNARAGRLGGGSHGSGGGAATVAGCSVRVRRP
jgi:hypothetical protein